MSFPPVDDINPFEAPRAGIGRGLEDLGTDADAELIRRAHLGHEASVKSIGSLNYLGAVLLAGVAIFFGVLAANPKGPGGPEQVAGRVGAGLFAAIALALCVVNVAIGYGLTRLRPWARWTTVVLIALNILGNLGQLALLSLTYPAALASPATLVPVAVSFLIMGYVLYLLVSARGGVVFSPAYRQVIAKTPHIKYKTSVILKVFLLLVLAVIIVVIVGALMNRR